MTDNSPEPETALPAQGAAVANLDAARYAKLLFGHGAQAWRDISVDEHARRYILSVEPPFGQQFTQDDFEGCLEVLKNECGIVYDATRKEPHFSPRVMSFPITGEDMDWMCQEYGFGQKAAGKLITASHTEIHRSAVANDPMAVLREQLRLTVHNPTAWRERDTHKALLGRKCCEVFLPAQFLEQLSKAKPEIQDTGREFKSHVRDVLALLLPNVPVKVYCAEEARGTTVKLEVNREYYDVLDADMMQAKQQPSTNVTSIARAALEHGKQLTR